MPYDPDPRKRITHDFHRACLHAYHVAGYCITDDEATTLMICITAFHERKRVSRNTFHAARAVLHKVYNHS